ncbi:DUF6270 domain-containing protein [Arthrobacter globiformis]|uniref:DUF6270 domain-containing protein n=1 Tax=Arthrobacter globiformis TaxID=1665 RepID=UPI0027838FCF|nr:DUF6270 domain-containing protein [Arthrobacter globiformis]MDQ0865788.1 hypothetical protein [Arthrobacter globiformis]
MRKNVMVYGSSVVRDACQEIGDEHHVIGCVTGQSMISALSKPTQLLQGEPPTSALTARSLAGDIKSSLLPHVRRHAADLDVLVLDLNDESMGVVALPDGSYVTYSSELISSGLLALVQGRRRVINAATERHWTLWESSANRLFKALTALGLMEKTVVINAPRAGKIQAGHPAEELRLANTRELDAYLGECSAHIRSLGFRVLALPEGLGYAGSCLNAPDRLPHEEITWIAAQIRSAVNAAAEPPGGLSCHIAQSVREARISVR